MQTGVWVSQSLPGESPTEVGVTPAEVSASQDEESASHTSAPAALTTKPPESWVDSTAPQNSSLDRPIIFPTENRRSIPLMGRTRVSRSASASTIPSRPGMRCQAIRPGRTPSRLAGSAVAHHFNGTGSQGLRATAVVFIRPLKSKGAHHARKDLQAGTRNGDPGGMPRDGRGAASRPGDRLSAHLL